MTPICYRTTTFLPIVLLLTCTLIHLALAVELPLHYHLFPTENSDEPSAAYLVDIGFDGAVSGTTFSMVCQLGRVVKRVGKRVLHVASIDLHYFLRLCSIRHADASISQLAVLDERCCASITCNREENPAGLVAIQSCYTRNSAGKYRQ